MTHPTWAAPRRSRGPLGGVDGRVVLLLALLFGVLVWRASAAANGLYAAFFAALLAAAGTTLREARRIARWAGTFAVLWGGVKLALDLVGGVPPGPALATAGQLCVRLAALLLLGAAVSALVSPRALGLALAAMTRPVLRGRAWSASLALMLMVHFIPRAWAAFDSARAALRARRVRVSRARAIVLVVEAGTRNLARMTWDQTLAVAARRLDRPEAWVDGSPPRPRDWLAGAAVGVLAALAAVAL